MNKIKTIRFDPALEQHIVKVSAKSEQKFSRTVRNLCREALQGRPESDKLDEMIQALDTLRRNLAPIGSNLNQLAARFNQGEAIADRELAERHEDLQQTFRQTIEALKGIKDGISQQTR